MKKLIVVCIVLGMAWGASGKEKSGKINKDVSATATSIAGVIIDSASGEQLAGVEVRIGGTDLKTYTDFDGNFEFKGITPGEYQLITTYISYEKTTEELKLDARNEPLKIRLVNLK